MSNFFDGETNPDIPRSFQALGLDKWEEAVAVLIFPQASTLKNEEYLFSFSKAFKVFIDHVNSHLSNPRSRKSKKILADGILQVLLPQIFDLTKSRMEKAMQSNNNSNYPNNAAEKIEQDELIRPPEAVLQTSQTDINGTVADGKLVGVISQHKMQTNDIILANKTKEKVLEPIIAVIDEATLRSSVEQIVNSVQPPHPDPEHNQQRPGRAARAGRKFKSFFRIFRQKDATSSRNNFAKNSNVASGTGITDASQAVPSIELEFSKKKESLNTEVHIKQSASQAVWGNLPNFAFSHFPVLKQFVSSKLRAAIGDDFNSSDINFLVMPSPSSAFENPLLLFRDNVSIAMSLTVNIPESVLETISCSPQIRVLDNSLFEWTDIMQEIQDLDKIVGASFTLCSLFEINSTSGT